ncbi:MAG: hypothetical protein JWO95_3459 [Verrucomicrobiales bacterium]|nr:hypothetical protein [Verrucomicrobiales bacterium]
MRTLSPAVNRTQRLRILPQICARTSCLLLSKVTRNIVPGSTTLIVPSTSKCCSSCCLLILITCNCNRLPQLKKERDRKRSRSWNLSKSIYHEGINGGNIRHRHRRRHGNHHRRRRRLLHEDELRLRSKDGRRLFCQRVL